MKLRFDLTVLVLAGLLSSACSGGKGLEPAGPEIEKPRYLWFDASANYERFAGKDSIRYYLEKAKATGFTDVIIDVRPLEGDALYRSKILEPLKEMHGVRIDRDWDYLQTFIDEAALLGLKVTASVTVFTGGQPYSRNGMVYRGAPYDKWTTLEYTPQGFLDVKDDINQVGAFLSPAIPEVRDFCLQIVRELATGYKLKGIILDYCRFGGMQNDFSDPSRAAFEQFIGQKVENFPQDIFTWQPDGNGGFYPEQGKHATQWFAFRAKLIHDFIRQAKETIKGVNPDMKLSYWAASWYPELYKNGQNWASKKYDPLSDGHTWASLDYKSYGFAEHLDEFQLGLYLEEVWGKDNPVSVEAGIVRGKQIIMGDTKIVGSIYALNHQIAEDAAFVCLSQTDGLMVFDIVQVIEYDLWDEFSRAIQKALETE
jgi:uncharacterized lipoprotein YddW (UPF0748 family)